MLYSFIHQTHFSPFPELNLELFRALNKIIQKIGHYIYQILCN